MKIYNVTDPEFIPYGRVIEGAEVSQILKVLKEETPLPEGTVYVPDFEPISSLEEAKRLSLSIFGGVPAQFGFCNGHNTKLNCLEYHRCSEFNLGTEDFILILGRQQEIEDYMFDTSKAMAFRVPAGVLVEVYATSLHYAPCHVDPAKGFQVLVVLSKGTNEARPDFANDLTEDKYLTAANKWLLAHEESSEAKNGAVVDTVAVELASDGAYITEWTYVDLSQLGEIDGLTFGMTSSDTGDWGMNTPAYFAMDDFGAAKPEGYVEPERAKFPEEQGVENTNAAVKAVKVIRNGQVVILRGEKAFNILGAEL